MKSFAGLILFIASLSSAVASQNITVHCQKNHEGIHKIVLIPSSSYSSAEFADLTVISHEGDDEIMLQMSSSVEFDSALQVVGKKSVGLYRGYGSDRLEVACAFKASDLR